MKRRLLLLWLAAVLLALSGCGGGTTTVIERTVTVRSAPTTPTTVTTAPTTATTPTTPTSASERCPDVPDVGPTGADPADAVNVTVTYTDCTTATRLARRFYSVWIPSGSVPGDMVTVLGFRCGELRDSGGFTARVSCSRSASQATFDLQ